MGNILLITFYILTIITFFVIKRKLQMFETIFCWLIVLLLHGVYFMIITLNYQLLIPSPRLPDIILRIIYQQVITPIIVIWAMEQLIKIRGLLYKTLSICMFSIFHMVLKFCMQNLGIVQYSEQWRVSWSCLESILLLICTGVALLLYRLVMRKEGIPFESS
ncbi:hypothetical protein ASL11_26065 [Paenibacillus sp. Soil750]|nr:hypothetical protein ASL11_26065 [Paenibacillus sp. Soil750]